ncbi:MAG: DMT family transporter [Bacteroidota bacterium]
MKENFKSHLALFIAALIYGANYTIAKGVMPDYLQPFGFIMVRVTGAVILFWITGIFVPEKINRKDIPLLAFCGMFGVAINQLLFFKGLSMTTPINAAIIMVITPILVLLVATSLASERITGKKLTGIVTGLVGAILLLLVKHDLSLGSLTWRGDLCILINAISWGIYLVVAKPLIMKYRTITVIKWVFLFAWFYVLPFGYSEFMEADFSSMPPNILLSVAFVVLGTTYFAYLLNNYALQKVSSSVVSIYIYLQPLLAAGIAIVSGKDDLDAVKITSALLIFVGVYLVSAADNDNRNQNLQ